MHNACAPDPRCWSCGEFYFFGIESLIVEKPAGPTCRACRRRGCTGVAGAELELDGVGSVAGMAGTGCK